MRMMMTPGPDLNFSIVNWPGTEQHGVKFDLDPDEMVLGPWDGVEGTTELARFLRRIAEKCTTLANGLDADVHFFLGEPGGIRTESLLVSSELQTALHSVTEALCGEQREWTSGQLAGATGHDEALVMEACDTLDAAGLLLQRVELVGHEEEGAFRFWVKLTNAAVEMFRKIAEPVSAVDALEDGGN